MPDAAVAVFKTIRTDHSYGGFTDPRVRGERGEGREGEGGGETTINHIQDHPLTPHTHAYQTAVYVSCAAPAASLAGVAERCDDRWDDGRADPALAAAGLKLDGVDCEFVRAGRFEVFDRDDARRAAAAPAAAAPAAATTAAAAAGAAAATTPTAATAVDAAPASAGAAAAAPAAPAGAVAAVPAGAAATPAAPAAASAASVPAAASGALAGAALLAAALLL